MKEGNEKFHLNINAIKMIVVVVAAVQKETLIDNLQLSDLDSFISYNTSRVQFL